jgi:flagellar basal-body rod protein FlgF
MTGAMDRGLYIAASGMAAELARQDQIANDLANAATPGYKADRSTQREFGELLLSNMKTGRTVGPASLGVAIDRTVTDLAPAGIRDTGQPLDLAIEGEGFFVVQTPQGERFTRNGQFGASADGRLVTADGLPVQARGGGAVQVRPDGTIDPSQVRVVTVAGATKAGGNLFTGQAADDPAARVRAGALEGSGTNAARSMVDLIASMRAFEASQRAITTIDSTLQKAANQVGLT